MVPVTVDKHVKEMLTSIMYKETHRQFYTKICKIIEYKIKSNAKRQKNIMQNKLLNKLIEKHTKEV